MCIDDPESTTHSLSLSLIFDGANRHQFAENEKNVALFFSFDFLDAFSQIVLAIPSLLETDPQILEHWGYVEKITWANRSKRWIMVTNVSMTYHGFSESNTSDWLQYVWALPQNRFGGSTSWNTQPNCRVNFNITTALLSPFILDLLLNCSSTWRCA